MDKRETETLYASAVPSLVDGLSTQSLSYAPASPRGDDSNRLLDRLQPLSVNWNQPVKQETEQNVDRTSMEQQLLALTQQFSIELTPDQIEKVKGHQSSPSPTLFHSPTPDVIAPPQQQPPTVQASRRLEPNFSNSWNSWISAPKDDPPSESFFPSAHGDFSPPTFPASFSPKPPAPPVNKSLPDKSSSFDYSLLKAKTISKPKSHSSTWDALENTSFGSIDLGLGSGGGGHRSQFGLESISSNIINHPSTQSSFGDQRAKSVDYGLHSKETRNHHFDIHTNMSGLPEGFKKKVESLLKADCDDENDHMGHVLETKRHYAQILRISGSDESEEVIPQSTPIAPYVQIGPKAALSYSDRMKAAKVEVEDSRPSSTQSMGSNGAQTPQQRMPEASDTLTGHDLLMPEETQMLPDQLNSNYQFARVCNECYLQHRVGFDGFHYKPPSNHICGKTILCARPKGRELWSRVRSIPRHIDYRGPFLLCRHITQGEACPYAEACTFCYNREEEEIWTWERRGLFNRNRLFVEVIKDPLAHYMKQYGHHFYQSCKSCVDESQHDKCVCNHRQLFHIEPGSKAILVRECPDEKTMELCRYSSTNRCNRGVECFFAHSMIELDAWKMYTINDIEPGDIVAKSHELANEAEKEAEKAEPVIETPSTFSYKHRWICAQCYKNGQQVARRGKTQYCAAGRNAHAWRDPILICFIDRWSIVRDLQAVFSKATVGLPQTFVVCKNIRDKNKCDYGDVCQFSHSEEECKVWNYMKENNVKSLKQLYNKLMK